MKFEFDVGKSRANKAKHGIDFVEAQALWNDRAGVEFTARSVSEQRYGRTAVIHGAIWTVIFTYRSGVTRVISVRRARHDEERRYGSQDNLR